MKKPKIFTYSKFAFEKYGETDIVDNTDSVPLSEAIDIQSIAKNSTSKEDLRKNIVGALQKNAPSLADDDAFIDNLLGDLQPGEK